MTHANEELFRKLWAALESGDTDTLWDMYADDVVYHIGGRHRFAGDYRGKVELQQMFAEFMSSLPGAPERILHDVLANDKHIVALTRVRYPRTDGTFLEQNEVAVRHVRDGKIVEGWGYYGDPYAFDEMVRQRSGGDERSR